MYAIMLKDGDCIGLVDEPFFALQDAYKFIEQYDMVRIHELVCILSPYAVVSSVKADDGKDFLLTEVI